MAAELKPPQIDFEFRTNFNRVHDNHNITKRSENTRPAALKRNCLQLLDVGITSKKAKTDQKLLHDICSRNVFTKFASTVDKKPLNGVKKNIQRQIFPKNRLHLNQENVDSSENYTITIHETYQLGYLGPSTGGIEHENLYVFDFVDGLEVTYPVTIPASDVLPMDLPPLFLESEYRDQLSALAADALKQLTHRINSWLRACQEADDQYFIWRHMESYNASVKLRTYALRLLTALSPQIANLNLDPHSPAVDKIISAVHNLLNKDLNSCSTPDLNSSTQRYPIISLCPDPEHCLSSLRCQILKLIQTLLPQLDVPPSFDSEQDLISLLDRVCTLNVL